LGRLPPPFPVNGESIRTASPRWALLQVGVWTGVGVNGRFIHRAANVVDLLISGEEEPIGTTDNHPFWSEDRQEYVPAGELRVGENLRTVNGSQTYVQSIRPRGPPEDVYNLEVEGAHTYPVGTTGVLVHNSCATSAPKPGELFERTFQTPKGPVSILAEVEISGNTLHLKDMVVYGKEPLSGLLKNVVAARRQLINEAISLGFSRLRITGHRVPSSSSANPGHIIDVIIDLVK